jgi:hypothetical protein
MISLIRFVDVEENILLPLVRYVFTGPMELCWEGVLTEKKKSSEKWIK